MSKYFEVAEAQRLPRHFSWGKIWKEEGKAGYTLLYTKEKPVFVKAVIIPNRASLDAQEFKIRFKKFLSSEV